MRPSARSLPVFQGVRSDVRCPASNHHHRRDNLARHASGGGARKPKIAADALKARHAQEARERLAAGSLWQNPMGLVFTTPFGKPMHGPTVTRQFQECLSAAGIPRQRFHDLRHGAASLLLAQGVPMKVVQESLGHATISVTADVYGHLLPELQKDAAKRMDRALRGAV